MRPCLSLLQWLGVSDSPAQARQSHLPNAGKLLLVALALGLPVLTGQAATSFLKYLEVTANEGEAESQLVLGLAYQDGWDGTLKPGTIAFRWRELAAEARDLRPSFVLGLLKNEKAPVAKDAARALGWLNAAADHGDNYAQVLLGEMWLQGLGVPFDWSRGAERIRQAALAGFPPGQYRLGIVYLVGDAATPKDEVEALAWFIVAAEAGLPAARELRDQQTKLLGRDVARLAIKRSRVILGKDGGAAAGDRVAVGS